MSSKFSRRSTRVQPKPDVCISVDPIPPPPPPPTNFRLTSNGSTQFFPTTYTFTVTDVQLVQDSPTDFHYTANGTNGSTWQMTFSIPLGGGTVTGTILAQTPSGNRSGHLTGMIWSGSEGSFATGTWVQDSGPTLSGGCRIDFVSL